MYNLPKPTLSLIWKERINSSAHRRASKLYQNILAVLILIGVVIMYATLSLGENSIHIVEWLIIAGGVYLTSILLGYLFIKKGRLPKRTPYLQAWLYRAIDVVMLIFSSLLFFDVSIIMLHSLNRFQNAVTFVIYLIVGVYLSTAIVIFFLSPLLIRRKYLETRPKSRARSVMLWAIGFPTLLTGGGVLMGLIFARLKLHDQAFIVLGGGALIISFAIIAISSLNLNELILLALNKLPEKT
jgi:hypothetical protein